MSKLSHCFKYYDELDYDLQNLVLSKVRNPQNKDLLNDITNYNKQKTEIYNKYLQNGFEYTDDYKDDFNIHAYIDNDLMLYYNKDEAYMYGISDSNKNKLERQLAYNIKKNKNGESKTLYDYHLNINIGCISKVNRYIANMTIDERQEFIDNI